MGFEAWERASTRSSPTAVYGAAPNGHEQQQVFVPWVGSPVRPPRLLRSTRRRYGIEYCDPEGPDALEALLGERRPRILVIDVEICSRVGMAALRHLHRHHPATDWLLSWPDPGKDWVPALVGSGARGGVPRGVEDLGLTQALDAVIDGEIWLPRRMVRWVYEALVDTPIPPDMQAVEPVGSPSEKAGLTPREAEALELMRHGLTNREIAQRLDVSINTVKKHLTSGFAKLGLRSRRQARC